MLGYREALRVLRDPGTFTSTFGTGTVSRYDREFAGEARTYFHTLNLTDPPEHTPLRRRCEAVLRRARGPEPPVLEDGDFVARTAQPMSRCLLQQLIPGDFSDLIRSVAYAEDGRSGYEAEQRLLARLPVPKGDPDEVYFWRLLLLSGQESTAAILSALLYFGPVQAREQGLVE